MDFIFSAEQDQLRAAVRSVLDDAVTDGVVRAAVDGDPLATHPATRALWARTVELGWAGMLADEAHGGLGLGLVDAVAVLEEMGRVTAPGPFLSSAVGATTAAGLLGLDDLLADLATGSRVGVLALEEAGHGDPLGTVRTRAVRKGADWRLHGIKPVVLDADIADVAIVAARTDDGIGTFLVERPAAIGVALLDPSRRAGRLELDGTDAEPVGPDGDHRTIWRRVADTMAVGLAAELVGLCEAALAMATEYADVRVQFDVPLSKHQVIQHKLVDMLHVLEMGRVGVHHAAWAADVDDSHAGRSAAIAKAWMGEAAVAVTGDNIQIHGAVGFTWDSDAHVLFKRAKQNDLLYGHRSWQRSRIAEEVAPLS
ncbi:MAG: acyl-CoA dehydrogenase family protein [Microthrixaceae bacterium]